MRALLGSLTTRGRAFLSSGVAALAASFVVGLDDLARVGLLLLVLPLLSAAVVTRGRHRLGLSRSLEPTQVTVGRSARVRLRLSNEGRSPTGLLLLEEQLPYPLGVRPRFVIDKMGTRWSRTIGYQARCDVRGRFTLGPMRVRVHDPFGLVQLERTFSSTADLVVTPPVLALPSIPLQGVWTGSGDNRPRDFSGGNAEDVMVREYRHGDDLRRVHWRSSAHSGELMVRREEEPWQSRATIYLDNRQHAHRGHGHASSLEYAVTAAASIALHLVHRGFRVRLVTADGPEGDRRWHEHGAVAAESGPLLEALALVQTVPRVALDTSWLGDSHRSGLLVAILGEVGAADRPALARLRHGTGQPLAIALDVEHWGRPRAATDDQTASLSVLASAGWRGVVAGSGSALPAIWEQLGLLSAHGRLRGLSRVAGGEPS